jgi:ribonuclease BN (tRNA processing enzyme)
MFKLARRTSKNKKVCEIGDLMQLTILGSGTVVPDGNRNSAGYFMASTGVRLMLDCGAGTVHALARYGLPWEQLTHLFISHFHVDHVGELGSLFGAFKHGLRTRRTEALTVIGPRGLDRVMSGLKQAISATLFETPFPVEIVMLEPGGSLELAPDCILTVAKTPHTEESLAVKLSAAGRTLCYTGDTEYSEDLVAFFESADLLVSECSFPMPRSGVRHLSIGQVAYMAARAQVRRLLVTHFYFEFDEQELKRELGIGYPGEVIVGEDGMSIQV